MQPSHRFATFGIMAALDNLQGDWWWSFLEEPSAGQRWRIEGDRNEDGSHRAGRLGVFTWLVVPVDEGFEISAAHNSNLRPDIAHRLNPQADAAATALPSPVIDLR